jgi:hypothetical protein
MVTVAVTRAGENVLQTETGVEQIKVLQSAAMGTSDSTSVIDCAGFDYYVAFWVGGTGGSIICSACTADGVLVATFGNFDGVYRQGAATAPGYLNLLPRYMILTGSAAVTAGILRIELHRFASFRRR